MTLVDELRRVALFEGLTDDELRRVAESGSEKVVRAGEVNGREGEPVEHLYVILEGELRITKKADGGEVVINVYTPGMFFAEVPLLAGTPFLATGRALTDCRFFLLPDETFRHMLTAHPSFSRTILETMAQRVQILQSITAQRERLNSLSTLAAGLAHELNNPAAAARRAVRDLHTNIEKKGRLAMRLGHTLNTEQCRVLATLEEEAVTRAASPPSLEPLQQGDLEDEVAGWLDGRGVENGYELAPAFVEAGLDPAWLEAVEVAVPGGALPEVLDYLGAAATVAGLLGEAEAGLGRVSDLVEAAKSYSNMDRAPLVDVDVNEGIEQTLAVLGYKLEPKNVEVTREYDPDLPRITAYGGELNQVWTNLIDNAIDAADGGGNVWLRTTCEGDGVLVEVANDGPGVPEELQARVFEPFYTTKGVGAGVGLGLDISYRIVVGRHGGDIRVVSRPGDTRFQVRLPLEPGGGIGGPSETTREEVRR